MICRLPSCTGLLYLLCCSALTTHGSQQTAGSPRPSSPPPRVAIIGGGVAAASAAYFLRDLLHVTGGASGPTVEPPPPVAIIDVYADEPEAALGGRVAVAEFDGRRFESGGSIIHQKNLYMKHFAERVLGLSVMYQSDEMRLAIHNGKEAVLDSSDWYVVKMVQLLHRYGVSAFVQLSRFVGSLLKDFSRVYARQNRGQAFTSVRGLLAAMSESFPAMAQETIDKVLQQHGFDSTFINELVAGAMRSNYGQNVTIHGFVGAVSLAGAEGGLWSVRGGNRLIVEGLLKRLVAATAGCRLHSGRWVSRISREAGSSGRRGWLVASANNDGSGADAVERYDQVILTVPVHQRFDIQIDGASSSPDRVDYQTTVATFVKGTLNHAALGLSTSQERYSLLTGTPVAPLDFNSIGFQFDVEGRASDGVYKVFSQAPLTDAQLARLFSRVESTRSVSWLAYPLYNARASSALINASFVLDNGLYHTAPIELAASAMEMAAVAGRNAALLAYNDWTGRSAGMTDPAGVEEGAKPEEWVALRHIEL